MTAYFIDEFGIVSAVIGVLVAIIFWKKQDLLDLQSYNAVNIDTIKKKD